MTEYSIKEKMKSPLITFTAISLYKIPLFLFLIMALVIVYMFVPAFNFSIDGGLAFIYFLGFIGLVIIFVPFASTLVMAIMFSFFVKRREAVASFVMLTVYMVSTVSAYVSLAGRIVLELINTPLDLEAGAIAIIILCVGIFFIGVILFGIIYVKALIRLEQINKELKAYKESITM